MHRIDHWLFLKLGINCTQDTIIIWLKIKFKVGREACKKSFPAAILFSCERVFKQNLIYTRALTNKGNGSFWLSERSLYYECPSILDIRLFTTPIVWSWTMTMSKLSLYCSRFSSTCKHRYKCLKILRGGRGGWGMRRVVSAAIPPHPWKSLKS